jgi:hypothetical protein
VAEEELDLVQFADGIMPRSCECPPQACGAAADSDSLHVWQKVRYGSADFK